MNSYNLPGTKAGKNMKGGKLSQKTCFKKGGRVKKASGNRTKMKGC